MITYLKSRCFLHRYNSKILEQKMMFRRVLLCAIVIITAELGFSFSIPNIHSLVQTSLSSCDSSDNSKTITHGNNGNLQTRLIPPDISTMLGINAKHNENKKHDLWIVGAGTLGENILKRFHSRHPELDIVAETATSKRHNNIKNIISSPHVQLRLRCDRDEVNDACSAKNVIVCVPPSSSFDYPYEVNEATKLWAGPQYGGKLLFVSSAAVYGDVEGKVVTFDETSAVDKDSARAAKLISAEEVVLSQHGSVVRMSGLYTHNRGPHTYWMQQAAKQETIATNAKGYINLIHYEDAAELCLAVLAADTMQHIFLGVDNEPLTREELYAAARDAFTAWRQQDIPAAKFATNSELPEGRICRNELTRVLVHWRPKYPSFRTFMQQLPSLLREQEQEEL